jgi:hypothetical protein
MIGGTSFRGALVIERGCDMVVEGAGEVAGEEGDTSVDWDSEEEEGEEEEGALSSAVSGLLLVASAFRETPRRVWISSGVKPLDSRKDTLWFVDASRIESSSRNRAAWSTRSCREADGAASEFGDEGGGSAGGLADCCCHEGMDGFLDVGSDMVRAGRAGQDR